MPSYCCLLCDANSCNSALAFAPGCLCCWVARAVPAPVSFCTTPEALAWPLQAYKTASSISACSPFAAAGQS